ncbi:MAG: glycosyltransferase family 4 protein [Pyrinomonadaceae bacterium]
MRILQISSARHFGGGERHFKDLCQGLHERGHDVFAALRPTNEWQDRLDFLPSENILHVSIRNSFGVFSAKRIADFLKDNEVEIAHAHVARDYVPASLACILAKNARFILTRHVVFPLKPFNRFALRNLVRAIAVSAGVETSLMKVFPPDKIARIQNGIDAREWSHSERRSHGEQFRNLHNIPIDAPVIGTVGELTLLKGHTDFVEASKEIAARFPEARFVVAGVDNSADGKYLRELKRLVRIYELDERYVWLDWLNDTGPLIAALDIFVSPSHSESFGLAMLEAMSNGTPVVATATDGARELFGGSELLVAINRPDRLAQRICELISDPMQREHLAADLQTRAVETFSLQQMIDKTQELYRQIAPVR